MAEAVRAAHEELYLTGFVPIAGGTLEGQALYRRALELISKAKSEQGVSPDDLPDVAPSRRDTGAGIRARASAAIVDAAGKEGKFLAMLSRFSRAQVQSLGKADERAADAVSAAVAGERQAQRGVAGALQQAVQGLLRTVLGREPTPDSSASAASEAAAALERGSGAAPAGAPSAAALAAAEGLAAALPATIAELAACRDALAQEVQVLRARGLEERKAVALLQQQRELAAEELSAVRRELEAGGRCLQLLRFDLEKLPAAQRQECGQAARSIGALVQAVVFQEMDALAGHLANGLAPVRDRLGGSEAAMKASGAALDTAVTAAHSRAEAAATGAKARTSELGEVCGRLGAAQERAAQAAGAAEAAAGRAASGLLAAAESLKGVGAARGEAEDARERFDLEFRRYRAGHAAALEEHHALFQEGLSRGPLSLFKEFRSAEHKPGGAEHKPESLPAEKCTAEQQHRGVKRPLRGGWASTTERSGAPASSSKVDDSGSRSSSPVPTPFSDAVSV